MDSLATRIYLSWFLPSRSPSGKSVEGVPSTYCTLCLLPLFLLIHCAQYEEKKGCLVKWFRWLTLRMPTSSVKVFFFQLSLWFFIQFFIYNPRESIVFVSFRSSKLHRTWYNVLQISSIVLQLRLIHLLWVSFQRRWRIVHFMWSKESKLFTILAAEFSRRSIVQGK